MIGVNQYAEVKRNSDVKDSDPRTTKQILALGERGTKADVDLLDRRFKYQQRTGDLSQGVVNERKFEFFEKKADLGNYSRTASELGASDAELSEGVSITNLPGGQPRLIRNSSVQPNNVIEGDGASPKPFEPLSGVDSTSEDVSRNILPVNQA